MKIVRYDIRGKVKYGIWDGDVVRGIRGNPFSRFRNRSGTIAYDGTTDKTGEVRLRAPCLPSKVVCLGLNYRSHAEETKMPIPSQPLIFLKPSAHRILKRKAKIEIYH